ncbi:MAG: LuxR C-terminal-related transcriptional regulator [Microthrixaceae bacterium]
MDVMVVDAHPVLGAGLSRLLADEPQIGRVRFTSESSALFEALAASPPDLVLLDWELPDGAGPAAVRRVRRQHPDTRLIVTSGEPDDLAMRTAFALGCDGYLSKDRPHTQILAAVATVARGQVAFDRDDLGRITAETPAAPAPSPLTERELQVLALLADGRTNKEIAAELYLSSNTVRNHLYRMGRKLEAGSRLDIVVKAVQLGLVSIDRDLAERP